MLRNKSLFQIPAACALILSGVFVSFAQKTVRDKTKLARFETIIAAGNYAEIERDLLDYAIANPGDARAFELLGKLRFAQNRLSEAKSLYQKSLTLDARSASARIGSALVAFQTGDAAQSARTLNEIDEADIAGASLRLRLAEAFAVVGDCPKALKTIEKLNAETKNAGALPLRARCLPAADEKQKAAPLVAAAKNLAEQNPATAVKFAEVLSERRMYTESADVLRAVVAVVPQNADALVALAKSEIYLKDLKNAEIYLGRASKIKPDSPDALLVRAMLESERGDAARALDLLEKALAANPRQTKILSRFVVAAMRAAQAGKAFRAAEKLLESKPDEPEFLYLHGASALQGNNLPAAENSLRRLLELRPADARGCLALGLTLAAQPARLKEARGQLQSCIDADPNDFEAKYQLGLSYKSEGETAKAIEYLEDAVKLAPGYALALRDLGATYLQSRSEAKARVVLEKSAALNPQDADTHFQLSRLYNLTGETVLAKKHLDAFQKLKNSPKTGVR